MRDAKRGRRRKGRSDCGRRHDRSSLVGGLDLARAGVLYDAVLAPLGYVRVLTHERALGWGPPGARDETFAILSVGEGARPPGEGSHVAFTAPNREAVDRFQSIATAIGAIDEGAPGLRPKYGPGYYAAFVRDPDGYRIEAV
jgi:catechol 2,3-dioxygenase-like lactoylglutathione lyase family enzyme